MIKVEASAHINRPLEEVFEFVTDLSTHPKWRHGISSEWTSDGPVGVGSTARSVNKMLGREMESIGEITAWDPPYKHSVKAVGGPVPFENVQTFESKEGGTKVTFKGQAEVRGLFKLVEGLVSNRVQKQFEKDLQNLKKYMEGGQG